MIRKIFLGSLFVGSVLAGGISTASASLYIYPVKAPVDAEKERHDVSSYARHGTSSPEYFRGDRYRSGHEYYREDRAISRAADSTINDSREPQDILACYGRQVPIEIAMESILDPSSVLNISPSAAGKRVSWSLPDAECNTVLDIVNKINESDGVFVSYNGGGFPVGVGSSQREAGYYAHENPKVWHSDPTMSIKENLTSWAESEGWSVEWPVIMDSIDFEATRTTLYGDLIGNGGVFHRVVRQIAERDPNITLSVQFWANNYIVVKQGGFENNEERGD